MAYSAKSCVLEIIFKFPVYLGTPEFSKMEMFFVVKSQLN